MHLTDNSNVELYLVNEKARFQVGKKTISEYAF
jgi:hypothetical protein